MDRKRIELTTLLIGILDLAIGFFLVSYLVNVIRKFFKQSYFDFFILLWLIGIILFVFVTLYAIWIGLESVRLRPGSRVHNLVFYLCLLYLATPIGLLFAIFSRAEPILKRISCVLPALISLLIVLFLNNPKVKEQFK